MEELLRVGLRSVINLAFPGLSGKLLDTVVRKLVGILISIDDPIRRDAEITVAMAELKAALPIPVNAVRALPMRTPPKGGSGRGVDSSKSKSAKPK